ncbi:MAG: 50S ribosomal protein L25 [Candidatus Marinimicrobia bacterium]|nr:50S ribosomal protein L25 [Candidatus Neomarinimicrobiota bacterium]
MTELALKADAREGIGKEKTKKLRKQGVIPAVFYQKEKSQAVQINELEFLRVMKAGNQLIELNMDGKKKKALIREIQYHPVNERIVHVDFQGVSMSEVIQVLVPLNFIGTPVGVREGGIYEVHLHELEIKCKASEIPHQIDINIEKMTIGATLFVSNVTPGDFEIITNSEQLIAAVVTPKGTAEEETAEAAEGAEAEETEEEGTEE